MDLYNQKSKNAVSIYKEKSKKETDAIDLSIAVLKEQIRSLENAIIELERQKND